jgi:hypothetical protein
MWSFLGTIAAVAAGFMVLVFVGTLVGRAIIRGIKVIPNLSACSAAYAAEFLFCSCAQIRGTKAKAEIRRPR